MEEKEKSPTNVERLDEAFNDLRRKVDYIVESCKWQNQCIAAILNKLNDNAAYGGRKSENRHN